MSFIKVGKGEVTYYPFKKKASTAFTRDTLVTTDASGWLVPADATTTPDKIVGIIRQTIASTDADYASNTLLMIEVPCDREDIYMADVGTGTATQAMVNTLKDLTDNASVDVTANAVKPVRIERFVSASKVVVSFRPI